MYLAAPVLATAGLLDINATLVVELIAFIVMIVILARYAYPAVLAAAESRQRAAIEALEAAERERQEADARLREAEERLREAGRQAQDMVDRASRAAEELRTELRRRGEEEAAKIVERARREIEGERQAALDSARGQLADMVVAATQKVIVESLDEDLHRRLIEQAVAEVDGSRVGADGRGQG